MQQIAGRDGTQQRISYYDFSNLSTHSRMESIHEPFATIADWDLRYPEQGGMVISGLADVRTTPVMYLPQAAGMALVRAFGGSALSLVFAARFLNLLAFLLLTSAAICRMPFGREILCGVGLLPMTLHLAASMSYDAGILGCSFLLCAEIFRFAYGRAAGAFVRGRDRSSERFHHPRIRCGIPG